MAAAAAEGLALLVVSCAPLLTWEVEGAGLSGRFDCEYVCLGLCFHLGGVRDGFAHLAVSRVLLLTWGAEGAGLSGRLDCEYVSWVVFSFGGGGVMDLLIWWRHVCRC